MIKRKRRSPSEWMDLVKDFKASKLTLVAWCRENNISKSSIYPYLKKYKNQSETKQVETKEQNWGAISLPKNIEKSAISLKMGSITLDVKSGFDKKTLSEILSVVMELC